MTSNGEAGALAVGRLKGSWDQCVFLSNAQGSGD